MPLDLFKATATPHDSGFAPYIKPQGTQASTSETLETHQNGLQPYFHLVDLETVPPSPSTSNSKAPQALLRRASFWDVVRKNNMPR